MIGVVISILNIFLKNRLRGLKLSKIDIILFCLIGYIIFNRYIIQSYYGFSIRFIELLALSVFYILLRSLPKRHFPWLLITIVLAGIVQAIYGMLQLLGYFPSLHLAFKMTGNFTNPGPYAGFLSLTGVCSLSLYLFKEKISKFALPKNRNIGRKLISRFGGGIYNYIPLLGILFIFIILLATPSRAGWIAFFAGGTCLLFYQYKLLLFSEVKQFKKLNLYKKVGLPILILVITILGSYEIYNLRKVSADGRLLIWKVGSRLFKENQVFGVGHDRFKAYYLDAQAQYFMEMEGMAEAYLADNTLYAFNFPLQFLVENGIVGFLILIIIIVLCFTVKNTPEIYYLKYLTLSLLLTGFVFGLFSYPSQVLPIKIVLVVGIALLAGMDINKIKLRFPQSIFSGWKKRVIACVLVFFVAIVLKVTYSKVAVIKNGFEQWQQSLIIYNNGHYKESVVEFEKVNQMLYKNGEFLMQYGKALVMAGEYAKGVTILKETKKYFNTTIIEMTLGNAYKYLGKYKKAEKSYHIAESMVPNRFYPMYLLVKLYNETGQKEKAYFKAREILNKKVKIPSLAIREIRLEMRKIVKDGF